MYSVVVVISTVRLTKTVFKLSCEVEEVAEFYGTQRQAAKAVTFGIMYGAGQRRLVSKLLKIQVPTLANKRQKKLLMTTLNHFTN